MKSASFVILLRQFLGQGMFGRQGDKAGAEQRVGPGGKDIELFAIGQRELEFAGLRCGRSSSSASARTFSGQRSSVSSAVSNSSEKSVILKNHCDSLRRSTIAPERQPRPSITCSLASTVMSTGSQFTSASPR